MRAVVIIAFTVFGLLVGAALDLVWAAAGGPAAPVVTVGLGLGGLLLGWLVARLAFPPRRRPIDPGRYPNRMIRRD